MKTDHSILIDLLVRWILLTFRLISSADARLGWGIVNHRLTFRCFIPSHSLEMSMSQLLTTSFWSMIESSFYFPMEIWRWHLLNTVRITFIDKTWSKFWHKYRPESWSSTFLINKSYLFLIWYFFRSPEISSLTERTTPSLDLFVRQSNESNFLWRIQLHILPHHTISIMQIFKSTR